MGSKKTYSALSREGFPYASIRHSPLWDPSSCNPPVSTTTCTHTLLTHSPKATEPRQRTETPLSSKNHTWQRETALCLAEAMQMPPIFLILQGCVSGCRKQLEPQRGVPTCRPAQPTLKPLLGSPALLLSPLGSVTFGSPGREVMKSAGAGRIFSSRPAVGREKHILFHVWFASVCFKSWPAAGAGTEHTPSSGFAICRWGQEQRGKRPQAGCTLDALLLQNIVLTKGARLKHKRAQAFLKGLY